MRRNGIINSHRYEVIKHFLKKYHAFDVNIRSIQRALRRMGLKRNGIALSVTSPTVQNALASIQTETEYRAGYRRTWNLLNSRFALRVTQESVRRELLRINPEAVNTRVQQILTRRSYRSGGPNHVWHIDGYDKLKPYGFCIHGCIDGFSRKILWLNCCTSNNDPRVVLNHYLRTVVRQQGCPALVRSDCGTETGLLAAAQCTLRSSCSSHIFGPSYHNQRIEAWWSVLRKSWTQIWMDQFDDLVSFGSYNMNNSMQRSLAEYCFMGVIQKELDNYKDEWNSHRIRRTVSSGCPGGKPNELYALPEMHGFADKKKPVNLSTLNVLLRESSEPSLYSSEDVNNLCQRYVSFKQWVVPFDRHSALQLYLKMYSSIIDVQRTME